MNPGRGGGVGAWEQPAALGMEPESLDLIVGSDLVYGGPKNGELLLSAINQHAHQPVRPPRDDRPLGVWMPLPRHGRVETSTSPSCERRRAGTESRGSSPTMRWRRRSGVDGVDIVELRQGIG